MRDLFLRFGKSHLSEDLAAFDYAITQRNGIVDLMLGPAEVAVPQLKKPRPGVITSCGRGSCSSPRLIGL